MSETINMRIRELRNEKGLTQAEFAAMLPRRGGEEGETVTPQAVSAWERGREPVPEDRYEELAAALGCAVEDLVSGPQPVRDTDASRLRFIDAVNDARMSEGATFVLHALALKKELCREDEDEGKALVFRGSLERIAEHARNLTLSQIENAWPEVMESDFIRPVTDAKWDVALWIP